MNLDKLEVGKEATVDAIHCDDKALKKHILDMGITPGVKVTLIKTAPMGDPMELKVRGYILTLRKNDAGKIRISNVKDSVKPRFERKAFEDSAHSQIGETIYHTIKETRPVKSGKIRLALIGNQNTGKTTLFNQLTGANRHVGNFPGVTVDRVDGDVKNFQDATITDLPGIYSLSPYSTEEIVTRNHLLNEHPDGIINIIDVTNIERNLFLTMQLLELNIPMVIALNMMDEFNDNGGSIDINGIENILKVPVIPISAAKNEGITELAEHAINVARYDERPEKFDFCSPDDKKTAGIHRCIHSISHLIEDHAKQAKIPVKFAATKLTEGDKLIQDALNLDKQEIATCKKIIADLERECGVDNETALADTRFTFIEKICRAHVVKPDIEQANKWTFLADKILTGKYTAIPVFLAIMGLIFYFTFGSVGLFLSNGLEDLIEKVTDMTDNALTAYGLNPVVHSLIIDGVFAGVGSVLSFLPRIIVLFFFLSLLEDSGYTARVAFVMDKMLRKIGLSGRSIVPMIMGFGCSVPAIMATRTLPSERDRKMTILLTPFMSCSAKLPIYALFTAAFFRGNEVWVILGLYVIGIIVGIIFAIFMKVFIYKGESIPFVMELPNYRLPGWKNVYRMIYSKSKDFITKAFTIIFFAAVIIWFLQTFDSRLNLVQDPANSLLSMLGNFTVPIFQPLGISDWRISTAFLTGFIAKESVVSTLTVLIGGETSALPTLFTPHTAFVFLVFSLLYTPCVASVATVKRELGKRYALAVVLIQCSIAWIVAYIVNCINF